MVILLSEMDGASGCAPGLQLAGQVRHPMIEKPQLSHSPGQLLALLGQQRAQLARNLVTAAGRAHGGQLSRLIESSPTSKRSRSASASP